MSIGVYTCICEEDACWIDQYLQEIERLQFPFAIHLDRCSQQTKDRLTKHSQCIGSTEQNDPSRVFNEKDKQGVLDILQSGKHNCVWALQWDIDETWAKNAPEKFKEIQKLYQVDYIDYKWVNLWGDKEHIRVDGPFGGGHRANLYNIANSYYKFYSPVVNGPKSRKGNAVVRKDFHDLVCIHWGLMTKELRTQHKQRWDRIYSNISGTCNPYGMWNYALDEETYPPTIIPNSYL